MTHPTRCPKCSCDVLLRNLRVSGWAQELIIKGETDHTSLEGLTWKKSKTYHCSDCDYKFVVKGESKA